MKDVYMRLVFTFTMMLLWWGGSVYAAAFNHMDISSEDTTACPIIRQSDTGLVLINTISGLDVGETPVDQGSFATIDIEGYVNGPWEKGFPQLPVLSMMIEVPQKAGVQVHVEDSEETVVSLKELASGLSLAPQQPHRSKRISTEPVSFFYDEALYSTDHWIQPERAKIEILGTMRSTRLARLTLCPFRYNPVTNQLGVTHRMTVTVTFDQGDMALTRTIKKKYQSPDFDTPLARVAKLPSGSSSKSTLNDSRMAYHLTYVVVASQGFLENSALQDFVSWKERSGYHVIEANTDVIFASNTNPGTQRALLKTYLQDLYDNSATPPAYILFVGDMTRIPSYRITDIVIEGSVYQDHYTDLYYCDFTGDYLPDAYYGRFPVRNETELGTVVAKTLAYEQYTLPSTTYLDRAMLIAGADNYYSRSYANGQVAYLLNDYVNTEPDNGFSDIYAFLFEPDNPRDWEVVDWSWPGTTIHKTGQTLVTGQLTSYIDSGVGLVNYTGHCDEYGWWNKVVGDYELDIDDIGSLNDNDFFGLYVANCCESSRFELSGPVCFGSKLLLAENKGAVAYLGAANYTFWEDDFYWAVGYKSVIEGLRNFDVQHLSYNDTGLGNFDTLWHTHDEPQSQWSLTAGQIIYSGNVAVDTHEYDPSFDYGKYYWEIYNVLGDPSLMPYLSEPRPLPEPDIAPLTPCVDATLKVSTVPYALVALTVDDVLLGSAPSDSEGLATLSLPPLDQKAELDLMITKQGFQPLAASFWTDTFPEDILPQPSFHDGFDEETLVYDVVFGRSITFINTSTGCPTGYDWTFEGADIPASTQKNPTVTYSRGLDTYPVTLAATNSNSESLAIVKHVRVSPYVNFQVDQSVITPGSAATFSPVTSHDASEWFWTFSDGIPETSTEKAPQVHFDEVGNYSVTLSVTINGETYPLSGPVTKSAYVIVANASTEPEEKNSDGGGGGCFVRSLFR